MKIKYYVSGANIYRRIGKGVYEIFNFSSRQWVRTYHLQRNLNTSLINKTEAEDLYYTLLAEDYNERNFP